ncbi:hypothetical protein BST81_18915 [Leptolyngbya sp. 'hensonii']|uniref:ergothioneine biosynthesis protein EgtB n=1 Tax=Leptolyngbya sp. 'hensonii' TaxID=1922337 RepID=UPI00094FBB8E|nr:ergothioneine biosynthesis protein EgtB [Leptolyngbya sp. 'hensonii']OLP16770.1 hypothetical protein BST81_18915 [Leptolyngbya sp. 'hensonii']
MPSPTIANDIGRSRQIIRQRMERCRSLTLALFAGVDPETFCRQAHPDFSPIGWHLGHIGFTEARWLLQQGAGQPDAFPAQYQKLFAADGLPKQERANLPPLAEIQAYLATIRAQVLAYLDLAPLAEQERLWRWLVQHESQHGETIALVLALQQPHPQAPAIAAPVPTPAIGMVEIPAGEFVMGHASIDALDNERPLHRVHLKTYWIDRTPVTCDQYRAFMEAGGYGDDRWWSAAGWAWLQTAQVHQPLYWSDAPQFGPHPVCGVSWYEAEAYARFVGKRLPTEAEWEKAAGWDGETQQPRTYPWGEAEPEAQHCNHGHFQGWTTPVGAYPAGASPAGCLDLLGNIWEWTNSWFEGYGEFESYPYPGYSQVYFDGQHRVLRGGSWATRSWAMRCAFRNWYYPSMRQMFAGFRCASDEARN